MMNDSSSPRKDELAGQVAVVTGASSGIGRATALELASAGAAVFVHAHSSRKQLDALVQQIVAAGGRAEAHLCDVADLATHAPFVDRAWKWQGSVDIWVNNAGADVLTGEAAGWPFDRKLDVLWRTDVLSTIGLSRLVGRRMIERGSGSIVNTGWDQAARGMEGDSGELFATTKGAIMAFSLSLAQSLAPHVRVNCVAPGWIKTAWGDKASDAWHERAQRESLAGRWGAAEDIARATRFLASPAAEFINGQVLNVNGGFRNGYPS